MKDVEVEAVRQEEKRPQSRCMYVDVCEELA